MIDFIDEAKQDLKRERYGNLARKYGAVFAGLVVLAVGGTAVATWHLNAKEEERLATGLEFFKAIQLEDSAAALENVPAEFKDEAVSERVVKLEEAASAFDAIATSSGGGYKELATLREAALLAKLGNPKEAIEAYEVIRNDNAVDPAIRDLANLQAVTLMVEHQESLPIDGSDVNARLKELSEENRVWKYSALEMQAFRALKSGDEKKALELFEALQLDPKVPENMFQRVLKMVSLLRNKHSEYDPFVAEVSTNVVPKGEGNVNTQ